MLCMAELSQTAEIRVSVLFAVRAMSLNQASSLIMCAKTLLAICLQTAISATANLQVLQDLHAVKHDLQTVLDFYMTFPRWPSSVNVC